MTEPTTPVDPALADFTAERTRLDGSRTFWAAVRAANSTDLSRWDLKDGAWLLISTSAAGGWLEAVSGVDELVHVRHDEITEYTAADPRALLEVLIPAADGDPNDLEWTYSLQTDQFDDDDDIVYDSGHIRRWATLNAVRLSWVESDPTPLAFMGPWDDFAGEPLARFAWDNGYGSGRSELTLLQDGPAIAVSWTDQGETNLSAHSTKDDPSNLASIIEDWSYDLEFPAYGPPLLALALEPLDVTGLASPEDRREWEEAIAGINGEWSEYRCSIQLYVDENTKNEIRESMRGTDYTYDRYRTALAAPRDNKWLLEFASEWDSRGGEW